MDLIFVKLFHGLNKYIDICFGLCINDVRLFLFHTIKLLNTSNVHNQYWFNLVKINLITDEEDIAFSGRIIFPADGI